MAAGAATWGTDRLDLVTFLVPNSVALVNKTLIVMSFVESYLQVWHPLLTFVAPLAPMRGFGVAVI
jgi:hypothetical protein